MSLSWKQWDRGRGLASFYRRISQDEGGMSLSSAMNKQAGVKVGPAGWSYPDWEGVVYPTGKEKGFDQLAYLAGFFDVIEINSTFYRPPSSRSSFKWAKRIDGNPGFRFTVKLYRYFTHEREALTSRDEDQWRKGLEPLVQAEKLGAVLAQFPYSFHYTDSNLDHLYCLRKKLTEYPLVVEIRHRSWDRPETMKILKDMGIGFCNIDQPRVSYSYPPGSEVTAEVSYVRLHGRNVRDWFRKGAGRDDRYNYLYSEAELDEWVKRIGELRKKAGVVFVIANNHYRGQAVCNSLQLKAALEKRNVPVPAAMLPLYPQLEKIRKKFGPRS